MPDRLLPDLLPYLAQRASYLVTKEFHRNMRFGDVSVGRWRMLAWLAENEPYSVKELTHQLMLKQPSVTRLVEQGVSDGLLNKEFDEADGRRVLITLTPKGREIVEELRQDAQRSSELLLQALGKEQAEQLKKQLNDVIAVLEKP